MANEKDVNIIDSILHEIKSPLSNITGYTKLLMSSVVGDINKEQRDYLSRIRRNIYRVNIYIDDVADVARILYMEKAIELRPVNLGKVIDSAIERNEPVLNEYRTTFFAIRSKDEIEIRSDEERLGRTIDVLISNLTKDINKRKVLFALRKREKEAEIILSHATETTNNIDVFLQRFERVDENHLLQHAATSTVVVKAIGGRIEMFTSNISERMFILSFPLIL